MKSKHKEGWMPKWVQSAMKYRLWYDDTRYTRGNNPQARRPRPTQDPNETNHERVVRQRKLREK